MLAGLVSPRKILRTCPVIIVFTTCLLLIWYITLPVSKEGIDDFIHVRLRENQEEYIDRRGIRVVVGHYVGDAYSAQSQNLSEEILNSNYFDPKPNEGRNGIPVVIPPPEIGRMQMLYTINKFNLLASDRIPLNRSLPDVRRKRCISKYQNLPKLPTTSVIIIFHNEAWSTLLRTVQSVIDRSPHEAIAEILLVDDASTRTFLQAELDEYVSHLPVSVKVLRTGKREGLVRARMLGAREAKGQVLTFLDAHCECTQGWLEPLLMRVSQDRKKIVCPFIDIINEDTFAYVRSFELYWGAFNWNLHFRWFSPGTPEIRKRKLDIAEPFASPTMAGGLFAIDKSYFFELGAYDEQMEIWGGENLELSFRVWQCGGAVEIAPCSHVGHIFRKTSPHTFPGGVGEVLYANLARVALVWMDEWKEFYFKFHPEAERQRDKQSIRARLQLRSRLKCRSFKWYLDNVWPQNFFPTQDRFFGQIKNSVTEECVTRPQGRGSVNQPSGPAMVTPCSRELYHMFVLSRNGDIMTDESMCLDVPDSSKVKERVKVVACSGAPRQKWNYYEKTHTLVHGTTGLCLDTTDGAAVVVACNSNPSQKWLLKSFPWR